MTPSQRAFLDAQIALSAWRAARDAEAQVAHWLTEGRATREELSEFRSRTRRAHETHSQAQRAYTRICHIAQPAHLPNSPAVAAMAAVGLPH